MTAPPPNLKRAGAGGQTGATGDHCYQTRGLVSAYTKTQPPALFMNIRGIQLEFE